MKKIAKIAIVGSSGVVGRTALKVLEEKNLKNVSYSLFCSSKSAGEEIEFLGKKYTLKELKEDSFKEKFDYAIFCAGGAVSKKFVPIATSNGCIVIDNSSEFRLKEDVPLVVSEVNPEKIFENKGIIANPNCSTVQAVVALEPLDTKYNIKRIVYSTYQSVSGAGRNGIIDLEEKNSGDKLLKIPHSIYNNCVPQIDIFMDDGYTKEEFKMIQETRKILNRPDLAITATTVRVPILNCHAESINVEFTKKFNLEDVKELLRNSPGIILLDDPANNLYPLQSEVSGRDEVFVGRIRRDNSVKSGLNLWVVADNLRKGAATNAVQILEHLLNTNKKH